MLELRSSRRVVDNIIKTFARCSYSLNFIKTAEATFSTLIKHLDLFYASEERIKHNGRMLHLRRPQRFVVRLGV